jgi:glycosyltransferase involved in cell wall biosynthesis
MTKRAGSPYVCFSAQDWWYHNTAHSDFQLMRAIAEKRRVLVVNSIGMRMPKPGRSTHTLRRIGRKLRSVAKLVRRPLSDLPDFYVMSPLPLPFYGSPVMRKVNAALVRAQVRVVCRLLGIVDPVVVVTLPTAWDVVRPMRRRSLVYNRSDRHSEYPEGDRATLEHLEQALLRNADRVAYVSRSLMAEEQSVTGRRAYFLDHGVDLEHFMARSETDQPADIRQIPRPRVGFFGALDDFVVDFNLLKELAEGCPEASLVLIGDSTHPMDELISHPNVYWLGRRPYADIPGYGSGFDVAVMPWLDNDWIASSNPIKLKEYLALGLSVVSTDFPELATYTDRVRIATNPAQFVDLVRQSLADGGLSTPAERRQSVLSYSWTSRGDELIELAERELTVQDPGQFPAQA